MKAFAHCVYYVAMSGEAVNRNGLCELAPDDKDQALFSFFRENNFFIFLKKAVDKYFVFW